MHLAIVVLIIWGSIAILIAVIGGVWYAKKEEDSPAEAAASIWLLLFPAMLWPCIVLVVGAPFLTYVIVDYFTTSSPRSLE